MKFLTSLKQCNDLIDVGWLTGQPTDDRRVGWLDDGGDCLAESMWPLFWLAAYLVGLSLAMAVVWFCLLSHMLGWF